MDTSTIIAAIATAIACVSLYVSWKASREQKSIQIEMRVHELRVSAMELMVRIELMEEEYEAEDLDLDEDMLSPKQVIELLRGLDENLKSKRRKVRLTELNDLDVMLGKIKTRLDFYDQGQDDSA